MKTPQTLAGREGILLRLRSLVDESAASARAATIAVVGDAGLGKTAVLTAFAESLRAGSWGVVCAANATAMQERISGFLLHELLSAAVAGTGNADRYVSGLESIFGRRDLTPDRLELGAIRFFEALTEDRPVAMIIDDCQWADETSIAIFRTTLERLAARPLVLIAGSRPPVDDRFRAAGPLHVVELPLLDHAASFQIVRTHYAASNDDVAETIVKCASGVPLEIVALSQQAAAATATRAEQLGRSLADLIRFHLTNMEIETRRFLQLCSIVAEPVPYNVLSQLADTATIDRTLAAWSPRYVLTNGEGLRFSHALVRDAIAATIDSPFAIRKMALDALEKVATPNLATMRDFAGLARVLGEDRMFLASIFAMAERAARDGAFALAIDGYAEAFSTLPEPREAYLQKYLDFVDLLRLDEQHERARDFLERLLAAASQVPGFNGVGYFAASLANVLWSLGEYEAAFSVCRRYRETASTVEERDYVESVDFSLQVISGNRGVVESARFIELLTTGAPRVRYRLLRARAWIAAADGRHDDMVSDLAASTAHDSVASPLSREYLRDFRLLCQWGERGVEAVRDALLTDFGANRGSFSHKLSFLTLADFAAGNWSIALDRFHDVSFDRYSELDRDRMLIPAAAILAFAPQEEHIAKVVRRRASAILETRPTSLSPEIVLWYSLWPDVPQFSDDEVDYVARWIVAPKYDDSPLFPITCGFGLFAERYSRPDVLDTLQERSASLWIRATSAMAKGWPRGDRPLLLQAAMQLRALGAHALAAIAAEKAGAPLGEDVRLLKQLRPAKRKKQRVVAGSDDLTPRELEVCRLVSDGLTNRSIAQRLFVSERTVETHIANAFSKLGAQTRTELTRILLESQIA